MGILDPGANIGYFATLLAYIVELAGHVEAVEPDPRKAKLLEASLRANGSEHVHIAQIAAGQYFGMPSLHTSSPNGIILDVCRN